MSRSLEIVSTILFAFALVHTFLASRLDRWAKSFPTKSFAHRVLHILGEVEIVFGIWAALFVGIFATLAGPELAFSYVNGLDFKEAVFVFVVMATCSSRPVCGFASRLITIVSRILPLPANLSFYFVTLTLGPLLGSFITEPAAMTLCAMILKDRYYDSAPSPRFSYGTLALLFVNISIGGVLTHFAAPPVLMVAEKWHFGMREMFFFFGWKASVAVFLNAALGTLLFRSELLRLPFQSNGRDKILTPGWITILHLIFLALIVATSHHTPIFLGLFLLLLAIVHLTPEHQDDLELRNALLVACFLSGLVVLGGSQAWWLRPVLGQLGTSALFWGATALTAIVDNAAITYLGAQVEGLSEMSKHALLGGAVCGGGLTIIANAPNPAGYGILRASFGEGLNPVRLVLWALVPTLIAMLCFGGLPDWGAS